jgi:hypothetical protein
MTSNGSGRRHSGANPYANQRVVLVTQHGKEEVLAPLFHDHLGARLDVMRTIDTDALGSFTREIPRPGTQLDAARSKAQLAIEQGEASLGIGSEGTLLPGPLGLGAWHVEVVLLRDAERDLDVVGRAHGVGLHIHGHVRSEDELLALAARADFPTHGLVLRPGENDHYRIRKGVRTWEALLATFKAVRAESTDGAVFVESDLRAHQHPTRMAVIAQAGRDLIQRLATPCPACATPGVGVMEVLGGRPCRACGTATAEARADRIGCLRCAWREERERPGPAEVDPARCPSCNP